MKDKMVNVLYFLIKDTLNNFMDHDVKNMK
jgi:hypothetical protein